MKSKEGLVLATKWKCSYCDEFKYQSERSRHEQSHDVPQFECKVCGKNSAVRRHEKQHERMGSVQCSECEGKFRDETLLKRHIQYAHKENRDDCRLSDSNVAIDALLPKKSVKATKWKCSYCDKEFKYQSERSRHEQSHVPQFECKVCGKKFSFLSAVRRHEKQHERTGSVQCSECEGKFRDETLLKRHIQYAHKGTYSCRKCDATLNSESALRTHMKTHRPESERRYKCGFRGCSKTFNFPHHLKHHQLTHTDDKQHFCRICGKGFIQLHHLKIHQKSHEPENWLPCTVPDCTKKFVNDYARKRHIGTHKNRDDCRLSDSNVAIDALLPKKSVKETVLCVSCGKLISRRHYDKHSLKCNPSEELEVSKAPATSQLIINSFSVNNNNIILETKSENDKSINKDDDNNSPIDNTVHKDIDDTEKYIACKKVENTMNTCKNLGGCLVSGGIEINDNCLCAQMATVDDDYYDLISKPNNVKTSTNDLKILKDSNTKVNTKATCEGYECSNNYPNYGKAQNNDEMPQIEYRIDGTVKIKETFDMDIETIMEPKLNTNGEMMRNESKRESKDLKYVSFSCKDVLGNCIVSGNSTMGEGCLCAKMSIDNQQMIAQEIEEITPCPKGTWLI